MNQAFSTYRPPGFHTVNTYLFVENPVALIDFLTTAFDAREINRSVGPNDEIANCIMQIGDASLMISQARDQFVNMRTALYLYVKDVDEMHQRALDAGAKEEFKPADMDYEDRQSGIIDPSGNYWWISTRLVEKAY